MELLYLMTKGRSWQNINSKDGINTKIQKNDLSVYDKNITILNGDEVLISKDDGNHGVNLLFLISRK